MKKLKLLIVEDDLSVLESIKDLVALTFDIDIVESTDPGEALKLLRTRTVDLMICDIKMPSMSGLELISILRSEGINIPIIMCSAHADKENVVKALRMQVFELIEKPFSKDQLFMAIQKGINIIESKDNFKISKLNLSSQQQKIMELLLRNRSNYEICEELKLSEPTVKYHVGNILKKYESKSRIELKDKITRMLDEADQ